ncbi:MAG: response regulator transcription factor [Deltaproteobacteria bacterium]|nr:response regulator transcription factor [Deltaproteobacteria bacterium]
MGKKQNLIEVLVVSSRPFVRKRIISILSGEEEIRAKGEASNIFELGECIAKQNPNIVIVNDDDKGISSLEAIKLINQETSDAKILLLIKDYDEKKELTALKMGVRGFLPESVGKADFVKCIRAISNGEMWVRRRVMEKLIQQLLSRTAGDNLSGAKD